VKKVAGQRHRDDNTFSCTYAIQTYADSLPARICAQIAHRVKDSLWLLSLAIFR
jgi:hypothetical protein